MDALPANATRFLADAEALAALIPDGARVAMPPDYSLPAMAVVRALVRRRAQRACACSACRCWECAPTC